jgi:DNA-binding MarR family transcriptional regulator
MNTQSAGDNGHTTEAGSDAGLGRQLVEAFSTIVPSYVKWAHRSAAPAGVSFARLRMLGALYTEGPLIMHDLSELLGVTPRNITALVDALEEEDLVERRPHPSDRRATIVDLTDQGRKVTDAWWDLHIDRTAGIFDGLAERDQRALLRILSKLETEFSERLREI